jgi:hypothetical protein
MRKTASCLALCFILCPLLSLAGDEVKQIYLDDPMGRRYQLALNRATPDILACYNSALAKKPGLAGRIEIRVTVEASGAARSATVTKDTVGSKTAVKCIQDVLKDKTWPTSEGPVFFDAVYSFSPQKQS